MSSDSTEINAFIERIPLFEKNEYEWKLFSGSNKNKNVRLVYMGEIKNNENNIENNYEKTLFVKEFVIKNNKLELLLKEVFFNYSLQSQNFFPKDIRILLSIDNNYLFLVFKGDNISLSKLIKSGIIDYRTVGSLTNWIIYQITFALYILHENKIIHHDIKPENILISQEGNISIIDFGSAFFKGGKSDSYTLYYSSPDYLINNDSNSDDEKYDMWSLGVVILELYLKQVAIFRKKEIESNNEIEMSESQKKEEKRKFLFSKFGVKDYSSEEELNNFKLDKEILSQIEDKDIKDLIMHLLVFNPNQRYSAKEILKLPFFSEFKDDFPFDLDPIEYPFEKEEISNNNIDSQKFLELINKMKG